MHFPLVEILFYLAVALAPDGAREIQITAPHFSAHWVLTSEGWHGGQYDKAVWTVKTRSRATAEDDAKEEFADPMLNRHWRRGVLVVGGRFDGFFPVDGFVEPALGRNWPDGAQVDLPVDSFFGKTPAGFVYTTHDGNDRERKYDISYDNDGSPFTDVVLSNYYALHGPNFAERYEVGLRAKAKCADQLPNWNPLGDAPIPISIGRAVELVQQASKQMPIPPRITDIRLTHKMDDGRDFWYYDFFIASQQPHTFGTGLHIGVLLDGTVLFPEPNPWPNP